MANKGFTLIELLVAISIIGVVFGVIITSSQAIQREARDTKRQSDLQNIQSALERYNSDQNVYPSNIRLGEPLTGNTGKPVPKPNPQAYLQTIPSDPKPSPYPQYLYQALPEGCDNDTISCLDYCIFAKVESDPPSGGVPPSSKCTNSLYNYYITQP